MMHLPLKHALSCTAFVATLAIAASGLASPVQTTGQAREVVRIDIGQFEQLLHQGNVVLVDVRSYGSYLHAHLPNAVSIPLEKLEESLERLRRADARIVLYCGGEAGVKSGRAAALLREYGFRHVYCLDGGFDQWVASGRVVVVQPTET
jgi:rhodanese-related sulfurtransferase